MELENDGMLGLKGLEMSATCEEGAKACTSADTLCSGQSGWSLLLCLAPIMLYRFLCEGGEGETIFQQTRKDLDAGMSISQVAEKFSFFTEGLTLADDDKAFLGVVARDLPRRVDEWACESGLFELQASNTSTLSDEGDLLNESEACARVSLSQDDAPIDRDAEEPYGEAGQLQPADAARFLFDYVDSLPSVGVSEYDQVCRCCLANCGKTGGLFSTPEGLASLISSVVASQVACEEVTLYDPCCGVGFALEACFHALSNEHTVSLFGQDADCEAYEICRLRTYFMPKSQSSWNLLEGDVLLEPRHSDCGAFDVVIACPPTLVSWPGDSEPLLLEDERFAPAGCLAPRESSDLAFAMHAYHCLARDGIGVLVLFPAPLRRGAQEEGIRRHLVESNAIEAVIQLPPNLFIDSSMSASLVILKKNRKVGDILFVDGKRKCEKTTGGNVLSQENVNYLSRVYRNLEVIGGFSRMVPKDEVVANGYRLTVSDYFKEKKPAITVDKDFLKRKTEELSAQFAISHRRIDGIIR